MLHGSPSFVYDAIVDAYFMPTARSLDVPLCCRPQILSFVEAGFLSDMRITGRPRSSVLPARHPPIQPRTQRCPRLRHALLTGSPPLTVFSVTTYLTPASTSNKTPPRPPQRPTSTHGLPCHAPKQSGRSPRTAASVKTKSAPWNRTSLRYCWTSEFFSVWRIRARSSMPRASSGAITGSRPMISGISRTLRGLPASPAVVTHQPPPGGFQTTTEPKPTPPETFGDNVFQTRERPAADEEDVRRVQGDAWFSRFL